MTFIAGKLNNHVFDKPLTPEAAYWIGFLLADGCISEKHGPYKEYLNICLGLKVSDVEHVAAFGRFVETQAQVKIREFGTNFGPTKQAIITIGGQFLPGVLAEYGIVPRKTKIDQGVHSDLKLSPDFWRGLIDGDGSISLIKNKGCLYPAIMVGGVRLLMEDFANVVLAITGFRPKIGTCRSIFKVGTNGRRAQKLIKWLYEGATTSLERKRLMAERCIAWRPIRKSLPPTSEETSPL
jgi:hypothetical protein